MTLTELPEAAETPAQPVDPSVSTARMPDGTLLRTLHWKVTGDPWAVALIVHGLGEHIGRYANVARPMAASGIDVHGYDHRGFGGSAGPRAWVDSWSQLHDDLEQRLTTLRAEWPGLPVVLYGHSMGGLIAAGYVLADRPRAQPDWLVLSAPGIEDSIARWKHVAASTLNAVAPRTRISNGPLQDGLCRDMAVRTAVARDPLNQGSSTVHFGHEAFAEQARVRAAIDATDRMPVPTYVLHGSRDPIVSARSSERLGSKANVTRRVHEGLLHECHNEPEHDRVMAEVVAWLRDQRGLGDEGDGEAATRPGVDSGDN